MVALLRPDSWDFPLFLHVFGAIALVGALAAVAVATARGTDSLLLRRVAFRTVVAVAIPAYVLMYLAGLWTKDREDRADDLTWIGIGFGIADAGAIVLIVLGLVAWWSARRPGSRWPAPTLGLLATAYVVALFVAMWAMTTKPD